VGTGRGTVRRGGQPALKLIAFGCLANSMTSSFCRRSRFTESPTPRDELSTPIAQPPRLCAEVPEAFRDRQVHSFRRLHERSRRDRIAVALGQALRWQHGQTVALALPSPWRLGSFCAGLGSHHGILRAGR
jgi:hypothetical protein